MRGALDFWKFAAYMMGTVLLFCIAIVGPAALAWWLTGSPIVAFIVAMLVVVAVITWTHWERPAERKDSA